MRRTAVFLLLAMLAGPAGGVAQESTAEGIDKLVRQLTGKEPPSGPQSAAAAALGSGDPVTTFATGLASPLGLAFDDAGNLYVAENGANRIARITPAGGISVFATGITQPWCLAFDAFGNLLVTSVEDSTVWKVSPQGEVSSFITTPAPIWIATAPDGSIWVSSAAGRPLQHYDAMGRFLEQLQVGNAFFIAFSPTGNLFYSDLFNIFRLVNGDPQVVVSDTTLWAFAFDQLGNIYAPSPEVFTGDTGHVALYGPTGSVQERFFVSNALQTVALAFGRDGNGATNTRIFLADLEAPSILEANPAGARAAGWPVVGLSLTEIALQNSAGAVLGVSDLLSDDELTFLDVIGNNNGSYDVGDFRAYLIATGIVDSPGTSSRLTLPSGARVGSTTGSR